MQSNAEMLTVTI